MSAPVGSSANSASAGQRRFARNGFAGRTLRRRFSHIKERKMAKTKLTQVETRLQAGAKIIREVTGNPSDPTRWIYSDGHGTPRADVVARLISNGSLVGVGDGLFGDSQTYSYRNA